MNSKFETVFRTYSYRLYPTKMQQLELKALFDLQDHAFNDWADLANRGVAQGKSYETIQKEIESHEILTERREDRYALSVTRSHVLTLARRLYDHQIERIRFRLPDRQQRSFTYKTVGISEHYLVIPSIGTISMRGYRPFPDHAELRYAKVQVDCYGAQYRVDLVLSVDLPIAEEQTVHYENVVGLDYTQNGLYVTNTGENAGYPGYRKIAQEQLRRHHRAAERFHTGSHRWRKHKQRAAKLERHIVHQRRNWQYQQAHKLCKEHDAICVETLDLVGMKQTNPSLAPKLNDNACAAFFRKLEQILHRNGKKLIRVDAQFPSSQICSCCGAYLGKQPLGREYITCPQCGVTIRRDHNAARNIRDEGFRCLE